MPVYRTLRYYISPRDDFSATVAGRFTSSPRFWSREPFVTLVVLVCPWQLWICHEALTSKCLFHLKSRSNMSENQLRFQRHHVPLHSENCRWHCIRRTCPLTFQSLLVTWCTSSFTFNNCTFCPHCIYVFCIYLRTNSDLCHLRHKLIGFYNRDEKCLLRGTNWAFK